MITYDTQQDRWLSSLDIDASIKPEESAAELIQHMIDIGDIIEQSEIEDAWFDALHQFINYLQTLENFKINQTSKGIKVTRK